MARRPDYRSEAAKEYRKLYKTAKWQRLRQQQLSKEPLCERCKTLGLVVQAEICDHITPHQGSVTLFYNPENLQSLCRHHHDIEKQREEVALGYHGAFQYRPEWIEPSKIPLTIVCGAPCSGKSTYVAARASAQDLVIDLDVIASELSGQSIHGWDKAKWLGAAMRQRNHIIGQLSKRPPWRRAWLIVSEAMPENRQWWVDKLKPESVVVLEVQPSVCMARARADGGRPLVATQEAIGGWWSQYERRDGDVIVKSDA